MRAFTQVFRLAKDYTEARVSLSLNLNANLVVTTVEG